MSYERNVFKEDWMFTFVNARLWSWQEPVAQQATPRLWVMLPIKNRNCGVKKKASLRVEWKVENPTPSRWNEAIMMVLNTCQSFNFFFYRYQSFTMTAESYEGWVAQCDFLMLMAPNILILKILLNGKYAGGAWFGWNSSVCVSVCMRRLACLLLFVTRLQKLGWSGLNLNVSLWTGSVYALLLFYCFGLIILSE